jgi:hypothetical protein
MPPTLIVLLLLPIADCSAIVIVTTAFFLASALFAITLHRT